MDMERKIDLPPMELASIGQQTQEQKKQQQNKKKTRIKLSDVPEKDEQIRRMEKEGHIDYCA
jgi:hypothetical protein